MPSNIKIPWPLFLQRADEFYILTRFSWFAFFQVMTFRMTHHTFEYYFKAGLASYLSPTDLKKLGHNLESLCSEYQKHVPSFQVDTCIIQHLNAFETMRYPETSNFSHVAWGTPYDKLFSEVFKDVPKEMQETLACFSLPDFDSLVFTLRSSLPEGDKLPFIVETESVEKYLFLDNLHFNKKENEKRWKSIST